MDNQEQNGLQFRIDSDRKRVSKKNRRTGTRPPISLFILIFLLFCAVGVLYYGYFDMKTRLDTLKKQQLMTREKLQSDYMEKLKSLNEKTLKFHEGLKKKVFPMDEIFLALESATGELKKELKKTRKDLDETRQELEHVKKAKADKDQLEKGVETFTSKSRSLSETLEKNTANLNEFKVLWEETNTEMQASLATISQEITRLDRQISSLSAGMLTQKSITDAISGHKKEVKEQVDRLVREMNDYRLDLLPVKNQLSQVARTVEVLKMRVDALRANASSRNTPPGPSVPVQEETIPE